MCLHEINSFIKIMPGLKSFKIQLKQGIRKLKRVGEKLNNKNYECTSYK